jgi:FMN phosphatase YigB (HAD superfamily)
MSTSDKKYLVLDFDECLFDHPKGLERYFGISYAETAIKNGCPLPRDEAIALARRSFLERGLSHYLFEQFDLDIEQLYIDTHPHFFHTYVTKFRDVIAAYNHAAYFDRPDIEAVILTHGTTFWAREILTMMGLVQFFPDTHIIGVEKVNFAMKHDKEDGFIAALHALGLSNKDIKEKRGSIFFVDDTARNLKVPHAMGFHTVKVRDAVTDAETLKSIDYQYPTLWGFLDDLYANKLAL